MRISKARIGIGAFFLLFFAALIQVLGYLGFLLAMAAGIIVGSLYLERNYG